MQISNLSLAPTTAQDPDLDLVWQTQWFVPSTSDGAGGKDFHVYAESFNGGALQCFVGENAVQALGGGGVLTYPGKTQLPAANCQSTLGPNGNITIYVPLSSVSEVDPIDGRLHEVTASTMTLEAPANSNPPDPVFGFGGLFFNLIDVAQGYVFDPNLVGAVSRKVHGTAGTFDIDLLPPAPGIECRSGTPSGTDFQVVFTFALPVTVGGVSLTSKDGLATADPPIIAGKTVTVNLHNVTNAQTIGVTLTNVRHGTDIGGDVGVAMGVLIGDTTADRSVNSADIGQTKSQSGHLVTSSNFREDVTVDGSINSADIGLVKSKSGTALP